MNLLRILLPIFCLFGIFLGLHNTALLIGSGIFAAVLVVLVSVPPIHRQRCNFRILLAIFCLIGNLVGMLLLFSAGVSQQDTIIFLFTFFFGGLMMIGFGIFAAVLGFVFGIVDWSKSSTSGPEVSPKSEEVNNDGLIDHVNSDEPMGGEPKT